jgi:hypothetical protein
MDIGSVTVICITVLVVAAITGKCYMEHIALETRKIRSKASLQQKNLDNVPYTCDNIWKKK